MTKTSFNKNWRWYVKLWQNITPPWRPSKNELRVIKNFLQKKYKNKKNRQALVLGATPEFRNILNRLKFRVTCLDINPEMYKGMTKLVKFGNLDKLVVGSWLDKPFTDNYFDVVLSDEALDNINYNDYDGFHKNVFNYLRPNGYYIYGCYYLTSRKNLPKFLRKGSFKKLVEFYKKNPDWFKKFENKEIIYQAFTGHKIFFKKDKWRLYLGWYDREIKKLYKQGVIDKNGYRLLTMGFGENARFTQMYQRNYEKFFKKYFKVEKIYTDLNFKYKNKSYYFLKKIK